MVKEKKQTPKPITWDTLPKVQVKVNRKIFWRMTKYLMRIAPKIGLQYEDILIGLGIKPITEEREVLERAMYWENANDEEREKMEEEVSPEDLQKAKDVLKKNEEVNARITSVPDFLPKFWLEECHDEEGNPQADIAEIIQIVADVTEKTFEDIDDTDPYIILELALRVFFRPAEKLISAVSLKKTFQTLRIFFPALSSTEIRSEMLSIQE